MFAYKSSIVRLVFDGVGVVTVHNNGMVSVHVDACELPLSSCWLCKSNWLQFRDDVVFRELILAVIIIGGLILDDWYKMYQFWNKLKY